MARHRTRLSNAQKKLIRHHFGHWRELESGVRVPANKTEQHFVAVCRGVAEAVTEHEVTYAAFKTYLASRGIALRQVEAEGFEPVPDLFSQASHPTTATDVQACPCSGEQLVDGWQARATDAFQQDGKETADTPGFIYRDNGHGNRRWNG